MIKHPFLILFIFIFMWKDAFCQQHIRIIDGQNPIIEYLQANPGNGGTATRNITFNVVYWSISVSGNTNKTINFAITSATTAPNSNPAISFVAKTIAGDKFGTSPDTIPVTISITIQAVAAYSYEYFTVGLQVGGTTLNTSEGGSLSVFIQEKPLGEKTNLTPIGFTYLNAVNFDFENSSGTAYVGHLNIFIPSVGRVKRKRGYTDSDFLNSFGMNLGIMKINYSKGGDSINTNYNYAENALLNPLDSIKQGTKFYRQYNSLSTTSKNTSWSFYFQPTFNLLYRKNFKLLIHVHAEFFVNTWSTTTTIKNLKQEEDSITSFTPDSVKYNLLTDNKFERSLTDPVTTTTSNTKLSFYYGFGITMFTKLWDGGSLFVQPTFGRATSYISPNNQVANTKNLLHTPKEKAKSWFHLTRFELKQELTSSLQAVVGVNVRGRFRDDPTYAAYIGINLGLDGIKSLFKN